MSPFKWPNEICGPVYFANSQWAVTDYGLESLAHPLAIERARLSERCHDDPRLSDWVIHLSGKDWVDLDAFCSAFERAITHHRVKGRTLIDIAASRREAQREREADALFDIAERSGGLRQGAGLGDLAILRQLLAEERAAASELNDTFPESDIVDYRGEIVNQIEEMHGSGYSVETIAIRLAVPAQQVFDTLRGMPGLSRNQQMIRTFFENQRREGQVSPKR